MINAIVFGIHGSGLEYLNATNERAQFIAGAVAGGVQCIVCSPMELVKIRFQMQDVGERRKPNILNYRSHHFQYTTPLECLQKIYKYENGIRGVYKGLSLTLLREVPAFGVYFSSYHYLCHKIGAFSGDKISISKLLFCGGSAGMLCWIITYPFDVIKTRQQIDGMGKNLYTGIIDCVRKSYQQEGFKVFFRGLNATLIRAFPTNAATLATVTLFLSVLPRKVSLLPTEL